jgi:hypothetical protein
MFSRNWLPIERPRRFLEHRIQDDALRNRVRPQTDLSVIHPACPRGTSCRNAMLPSVATMSEPGVAASGGWAFELRSDVIAQRVVRVEDHEDLLARPDERRHLPHDLRIDGTAFDQEF